jgi:Holliday junction resolvase RusA-like endonuclease
MKNEAVSQAERLVFYAKIELPYHATKKNGKHAFRGYVVMSERSRKAEKYLLFQLQLLKNSYGINQSIKHDLRAVFKFFFNDYYTKKSERRLNLPDLSNLLELPADCLQKVGIIENDTIICSWDGSRRYPSQDEKNYLEISLYVYDEAF